MVKATAMSAAARLVILTEAELAAEAERLADNPKMNGRSSPDDREAIGASGPADNILLDDLRERLAGAEGDAAQLRQQVADLRVERDQIMERSAQTRERAAKAEGEATALRDALADLSARLDRAEARLAMPWWKWLFG